MYSRDGANDTGEVGEALLGNIEFENPDNWIWEPSRFDLAQILFLKSSLKRKFSQVEEESGNERVVEPQRTLPVHARCEVNMLMIIFVFFTHD